MTTSARRVRPNNCGECHGDKTQRESERRDGGRFGAERERGRSDRESQAMGKKYMGSDHHDIGDR